MGLDAVCVGETLPVGILPGNTRIGRWVVKQYARKRAGLCVACNAYRARLRTTSRLRLPYADTLARTPLNPYLECVNVCQPCSPLAVRLLLLLLHLLLLLLRQDAVETYSAAFCSLEPAPGLAEFPDLIAHPELHPEEAAEAARRARLASTESEEELHPLADTPTVVG